MFFLQINVFNIYGQHHRYILDWSAEQSVSPLCFLFHQTRFTLFNKSS